MSYSSHLSLHGIQSAYSIKEVSFEGKRIIRSNITFFKLLNIDIIYFLLFLFCFFLGGVLFVFLFVWGYLLLLFVFVFE